MGGHTVNIFRNLFLIFFGVKLLSISLCVSLIQTNAFAKNETTAVNKEEKSDKKENEKKSKAFSISGSLITSSSLHSFEDHRHRAHLTGVVSPSYLFTEKLRLSGVFNFTRDLSALYPENDLGNPKLSLSTSIRLNPYLIFRPSIAGVYGINKTTTLKDFYIGSLFLEPRLSLDLTRLGLEEFSLMTQLSLGKNFHEFNTNRVGSSNTEYLIIPTIALSYQITDKWSATVAASRSIGLTYSTQSPKHSFALSQEVSWQVLDQLNINLSHSNGGVAYKENGIDTNISVFDENASTLSGGVTLTL
jgi:hypothetical protein